MFETTITKWLTHAHAKLNLAARLFCVDSFRLLDLERAVVEWATGA